MKKTIALGMLLMTSIVASAQQYVRIWENGEDTRLPISEQTARWVYTDNGKNLTINGQQFQTNRIDSITMVHVITVDFSEDNAVVHVGKAPGVTFSQEGANVNIVSTNTQQELEFVLQGSSSKGSLTYTGGYKCKFYLNGLNLTSQQGAALDIQCGKRVDLILNPGTINTLADAPNGTQKAALYCKGHLEVEGSGSLTVTGNCRHAIATKEYLQLKKSTGTITVNKAAGDAIHTGQYFLMNGGHIKITGQNGDGIQVEPVTLDDDITLDTSKENNGLAFIHGGTIEMTVSGTDVKGIKCEKNMTVTGGTFHIDVTGNGSKGIAVDGNMLINEDTNKTTMTIYAKGAVYVDNTTDEESRCMGIRVRGNLDITAGNISVYNTGIKSRGIKIDGVYTKTGTAVVLATIKN